MPEFSDQFNQPALGTGYGGMGGGGRNEADYGAFASGNLNTDWSPGGSTPNEGGNWFGNMLNKFSGGSVTDQPGIMEGLFGRIDSKGNQFKGAAGGLFNLAQNLGTGYMKWRNMKNLEKEADRRYGFMQRAEGRTVQDYNMQSDDINRVRASRRGGGNVREHIA